MGYKYYKTITIGIDKQTIDRLNNVLNNNKSMFEKQSHLIRKAISVGLDYFEEQL